MAAAASAFNPESAFSSFNPYAGPPLDIGERVVWLGNDEPEHGTVRWVGILMDICKDWSAGVEMDNPVGGMDGTWGGNKLFDCKPKHGIVIALNGLIKEEDFGDVFELLSPPSLEVALTNDAASSGLTNGYKTDDSLTDQKQEIRASENEGDKYIEKFLAAQSTPRTGASSFDRRVYARMFAECEVEKWYEVLNFPQDGACGSLDVGFEKSGKKKKDSFLRESSKDATLCRNGECAESKKKERGGIFRFFRWLRRNRSSKSSDGSDRRTRSNTRVSDLGRGKTKSLESVTSLSQSFHYIPVGVRCSEDDSERAESRECVYEDLDPGLQLTPRPMASKLKCSSMSRVNCAEMEKRKRGVVYEDHRPRSVRSACSPSLTNSSFSRKKRRAPLPPAMGTPAGRRSAASSKNHWIKVLPTSSAENAGSTSRLSNGDIALTHLGDMNRKMASSTGAIYRDPSKIGATRVNQKVPDHKRSASVTATEAPKVPSSPQRVGSHIKNKRKAPPPPSPPANDPRPKTSKGIQTEPPDNIVPASPPEPMKDAAKIERLPVDDVAERRDESENNAKVGEGNAGDKEVLDNVAADDPFQPPLQDPLQAVKDTTRASKDPPQTPKDPPQTSKESSRASRDAPQTPKESPRASKDPPQTPKESPRASRDSPQTPKESSRASKDLPQANQDLPQANQDLPQANQDLPQATEDTPSVNEESVKVVKESLQIIKDSPQAASAQNSDLEAPKLQAQITLENDDTPPELPKKQKCGKMLQRVETGGKNITSDSHGASNVAFSNKDTDVGNVAQAVEHAPGKPERKSSKVSSSSDSSPIMVKLKKLHIDEDELNPKAEAQMNIQALQELVETLVDQYCGNVKSSESMATKNSMSEIGDVDVEDPAEELPRNHGEGFSDAVPRSFENDARRSMSVPSSTGSGWMLDEKISNLDSENVTSTAYSTMNSSTTTTTSASETGEDGENDDQLAGRLLERWQARMREQMINMDFNLPEKQRRSKKVEVLPLRSQSVSEEENNGGIYEPIGNFILERVVGAPDESRSEGGTWKRNSFTEDRGSLKNSEMRGSKRDSGFPTTEDQDDDEPKDPFLFWRDLCARKYSDGSIDQSQASSEKLIRRLSVNGQRQPVKKDGQEQGNNPESGEDKSRNATAKNPKDAKLARASSFQSSRQPQFQIYENVFTATPHRMVVVDGISSPNQYENCSPAVAPYWAAGGPMMPYGRRYATPPYQALTVMPFMAPPMPHIYADPRFHPAGYLTPAFGGYVYPAHPGGADVLAPPPVRQKVRGASSRQAEKSGAGRTQTDRASDSPLQETVSWDGGSEARTNPRHSKASVASSSVDDGSSGQESADEECSNAGKKTKDDVPKTDSVRMPRNAKLKADTGKIPASKADSVKASRNAVPKAESNRVPKSAVPKAESVKAPQSADPKSESGNAPQNSVAKQASKIPQLTSETKARANDEAGAVPKVRGKSKSLERHSYANVPPSPPPRGSSSNRSSRLAANCDWLKEKSKSVEAKIKAARGENDAGRSEDRTRPQSVIQTRSQPSSVRVSPQPAAPTRPQTVNPKFQAKSTAVVPVPKPRKCDAGSGCAMEKPPAHPPKQQQDPSPSSSDSAGAKRAAPAPNMSSGVIIGGVRVPTPLNLWPLEYELIAPELRRLKARMEGKPLPEDLASDSCDTGDVDKLAVDRLLKQLEIAIGTGKLDEAATLARDLAQLKIQCLVVRNRNPTGDGGVSPIILNMFVEDKVSHHGPIPIRVLPSITVGELKTKIFQEFEFPTAIQRWILGKQLACDDKLPVSSFGVDSDGCPVFLYLLSLEDLRVKAKDLVWDDNISPRNTGTKVKSEAPSKAARMKKPAVKKLKQPAVQEEKSAVPTISESGNSEVGNTRSLGWSCEICTLVNIPTRPGCAMCGNERPADYVVPEQYKMRESELERREREKEQERAVKEAEEIQRLQNWQNYLKLEDQDVIYNEVEFECSICFAETPPGQGVKLRDCLHSFCCDCLRNAVTHSEIATVICPFRDENYSCDSVLQEREIRALVPPEVFERYLQRSMKTAESQAPNSFHCKTPDCQGWCLIEDNANEFLCPVCSRLNCITCRAIHQELNCRQYQDKLMVLARTDDEAKKTKDALDVMLQRGEAMKCPNCQVIIMKKWGCDWLCCSVCKTEICWVTKGPRWGPNGRGDLSAGCKCGSNGVRCHPNCTYCH